MSDVHPGDQSNWIAAGAKQMEDSESFILLTAKDGVVTAMFPVDYSQENRAILLEAAAIIGKES